MFNIFSDPFLDFAFWTGVLASLLTVVLVGLILVLRLHRVWRERRARAFMAVWHPALMLGMMSDTEAALPPLHPRDHWLFLKLWNQFQESVRGQSSLRLGRLAYRLNCDLIAHRLLLSRNSTERLFAILTLGHMRDRSAWQLLLVELDKPSRSTSLYAARALMQISAQEAVESIAPRLIQRDDWELVQITTLLQNFRAVLGAALLKLLPTLAEDRLIRGLRLAEAFRLHVEADVLLPWLDPAQPVERIVACLRLAAGEQLLGPARALARHPDWRVRVQAARALGRLCQPEDADLLMSLLSDPQWWVRYRAAQSLIGLPFASREQLQGVIDSQPDRYAREIFTQVAAELRLGD